MSGVEVAGLIFGVLPIIAMTAKAYRSTHAKFHAYRRYSTEIRHFERSLRSRKNVFQNHLKLLLLMALDKEEAEQILSEDKEKPASELWLNDQINKEMNKLLGDNWSHLKEIIEDIKSILHSLESLLKQAESDRPTVSSTRDTTSAIVKRLPP